MRNIQAIVLSQDSEMMGCQLLILAYSQKQALSGKALIDSIDTFQN